MKENNWSALKCLILDMTGTTFTLPLTRTIYIYFLQLLDRLQQNNAEILKPIVLNHFANHMIFLTV